MPDAAETVIERQLHAYNAKDVDGWLATYAEDACQWTLSGELLARGHAQLRQHIEVRFKEPDLHAELLQRLVFGSVVIDHERITRNFPQGKGSLELLCIYHVENGLIETARFHSGEKRLDDQGRQFSQHGG